jgi:endonuclease YncB( thermonuclease family)
MTPIRTNIVGPPSSTANINASIAACHSGTPASSTGITLEIHWKRVRLLGIDAPESSQLCRGEDSLRYRCGAKAANDLNAFIATRPVNCLSVWIVTGGR